MNVNISEMLGKLRIHGSTLQRIEAGMEQYLLYESIPKSREKLWQCTACGVKGRSCVKFDSRERFSSMKRS